MYEVKMPTNPETVERLKKALLESWEQNPPKWMEPDTRPEGSDQPEEEGEAADEAADLDSSTSAHDDIDYLNRTLMDFPYPATRSRKATTPPSAPSKPSSSETSDS